jgi:predicted phage terminase large subunit-like protein
MPWTVMEDMEADLGQYGYAGQIGQNPVPPGGGMFKVESFQYTSHTLNPSNIQQSVRYWDKAGSENAGAYTVGVLMHRLTSGKFLITDVKRGQWASEQREAIIRQTAEADGIKVKVWHEQEPGSGGKDSARATTLNLAGFSCEAEPPVGNKVARADTYSVQVNNGNVILQTADWNREFVEEHRFFPFSTYKDQVDAASGCFRRLALKKIAGSLFRNRK